MIKFVGYRIKQPVSWGWPTALAMVAIAGAVYLAVTRGDALLLDMARLAGCL
jgi:hypothetical protein